MPVLGGRRASEGTHWFARAGGGSGVPAQIIPQRGLLPKWTVVHRTSPRAMSACKLHRYTHCLCHIALPYAQILITSAGAAETEAAVVLAGVRVTGSAATRAAACEPAAFRTRRPGRRRVWAAVCAVLGCERERACATQAASECK
jgi:hypothetical protein